MHVINIPRALVRQIFAMLQRTANALLHQLSLYMHTYTHTNKYMYVYCTRIIYRGLLQDGYLRVRMELKMPCYYCIHIYLFIHTWYVPGAVLSRISAGYKELKLPCSASSLHVCTHPNTHTHIYIIYIHAIPRALLKWVFASKEQKMSCSTYYSCINIICIGFLCIHIHIQIAYQGLF